MANKVFTFIHAADLHLGAPFKGLTQIKEFGNQEETASGSSWLGKNLFNATYKALDRLVELCLRKRPHALLLAGDLYNPEANGLKSLTALRQAFLRLQKEGIVVCLVHGNHDPASSVPPSWSWPENVHAFSAKKAEAIGVFFTPEKGCSLQIMEEFCEDPLAIIYGISHSSAAVTDNLAKKINLETLKHSFNNPSVFQIGLVHCAVGTAGGEAGEHKPYAPCSLEDLNNSKLNYWALGHIHKQGKVAVRPLALYPGNTQGLQINEQGSKGCMLVSLQAGIDPELEFCPLAGIEWRQIDFELTAQSTASSIGDELYAHVHSLINSLHTQTLNLQKEPNTTSSSQPNGYIVRLCLTGRTPLNRYLRENAEDLLASLRERLTSTGDNAGMGRSAFIWLKDIKLNTQPVQNLELARKRDDLLGESLRRLQAARYDQELSNDLLKDTKAPLGLLFASSNARQSGLLPPSAEAWAELLDEAAVLCAELLGSEEESELGDNQVDNDLTIENVSSGSPKSTR